ncbi:hypothetical protein Leryth_014320 [Lithospermum erythrorhizon]|nr:hypothetical protein Leryth_014320 [Lithospermum erythrorhizon]
MLENHTHDSSFAANNATVKRYAPPNQRARTISRRKSGGDHVDAGGSFRNEMSRPRLISIQGCCSSEAFQLLNDRWTAIMNVYKNLPEGSPERPVLYPGKRPSPWGHALLPHQMMKQTGKPKDFLNELSQAMRNANSNAK